MKKLLLTSALVLATIFSSVANAGDYKIDRDGTHAFINFKIKHLGYSWLSGRFNDFDGTFTYDPANLSKSAVNVTIQMDSLDSNHADRDKHLKSGDFLDVSKFPVATFKSTALDITGDNTATITGELSLHGVTKTISFPISKIGEGDDPWGGYRAGFTGSTSLKLADFGVDYNLGPASTHVELELHIEGVRQ